MSWLADRGGHVFVPLGHSPDIDLVADFAGRLIRIEVKTTGRIDARGRWAAVVCTRGGNQSWSGMTKAFDPARCDFLFVHVADGRRWFIPADAVECRTAIALGGPKYSEYEIERGQPIMKGNVSPAVLDFLDSPGECQSGQMDEAVNLAAMPSQVRILSPPSELFECLPDAALLTTGRVGTTKIWGKRRVTIPEAACAAAGLSIGDRLAIEADGVGRLRIRRITDGKPDRSEP